MFAIATSFLTMALALAFLYVMVSEIRAVGFFQEGDPRLGCRYATARLWLSCALIALKLTAFAVLGGVFHPVMACVWALNAGFAWVNLKRYRRSTRYERTFSVTTIVQEPANPAVRLQEIKSEMADLDAEKRELEKHPDANRF